MILTALVTTILLQNPLPGSQLSLDQARSEARYIVVAEVGKIGAQYAMPDMSFTTWTELKPSEVLKGR